MIRIAFAVCAMVLVTSCKERFVTMDPTDFNRRIETVNHIESAEELAKAYYGSPAMEGESRLTFRTRDLRDGRVEVTLIHDGLLDDSQRAVKIILVAKRIGDTWQVHSIRKNWKCHPGRGHTDWGVDNCL